MQNSFSKIRDARKNVKHFVPKAKNLKDVHTEIEAYFDTSDTLVSVLMLVDEAASNEASAEVRNLFLSSASNVRLQITYFNSAKVAIDEKADMVVIVSCDTNVSSEIARLSRDSGVPAYTVVDGKTAASTPSAFTGNMLSGDYCTLIADDPDSSKLMKNKLGSWIANVCVGKKFAFASAFTFVARPLASEIVHLTAIENAAIGFVPAICAADFPLMLVNQVKMLAQIAAVYGKKLDSSILKEAAGVLIGAIFGHRVFKIANKIIPLPKSVISGAVAFGTTEAIGKALIAYFEAGGSVDGVVALLKKTVSGSKVASNALKPVTSKVIKTVTA